MEKVLELEEKLVFKFGSYKIKSFIEFNGVLSNIFDTSNEKINIISSESHHLKCNVNLDMRN